MDYQRACGCRVGRMQTAVPGYRITGTNRPIVRDVSREPASQSASQSASQPACQPASPLQNTAQMSTSDSREKKEYRCGDPNQHYPSLAIVYSPSQVWQELYAPCDALAHGTLFCELYKPWVGCCRTGGRMK